MTPEHQNEKLSQIKETLEAHSAKGSSPVDMSDLVLSLIDESAYLADVLHCSLKLLEMFDVDEIIDCVITSYRKSCKGEVRIWRDSSQGPVQMGSAGKPFASEGEEREVRERIQQALGAKEFRVAIEDHELVQDSGYVMEIVEVPRGNSNAVYIATLYFRHLLRSLNNLKDRLVIVKAFQAIREILDIKERLEGSLKDIKDHSNSSISVISEYLDGILEVSRAIDHEGAKEIEQLANMAMEKTQVGDLTNQKIFASLHNLEMLFIRLTKSLDTTSRHYLESLYTPIGEASTEHVASSSLVAGPGGQIEQSAVDDLLADLGL